MRHQILLIFIIACQLSSAALIEEPANCLQDKIWCAVGNTRNAANKLSLPWAQVNMGPQAAVVVLPHQQLRVLSQSVHIVAKKKMTIDIYNMWAQLEADSELFIKIEPNKVTVRNQKGQIFLRPIGYKNNIELLEGFQVWVGDMDLHGRAQVGFPRAIDLRRHLKDWSWTFADGHSLFQVEMRRFVLRWKKALKTSADFHQGVMQRSLASLAEKRRLAEMRRRRRAAEDAKLRQLFRRRNGLEE